ncbi:MAG: UDP-glucose 4-epimerase GalE [Leptospiraceae bacterium]|nr:UDP-glucose 4-epimerase GalE [Leptospiraceae bacterium]MDW7975711.1 UDP-glucose 4-epimerase GalE [Leptospiraceae bacterium]
MKALVIGGAGYIGSHVVWDLLERNIEVIVCDNFSTGNRKNIVQHPKYYLVEGNFQDFEVLQKLISYKPDVVFHFAASKAAGESMLQPTKYSSNNIRGTLTLLEAMIENHIRFFIFSSSAAVYGEPKYLPVDEEHPREPTNYYGFTKKIIEDNLEWFSKLTDLRYASLRYFNAAGYDVKGRVLGLENNPQNLLPVVMETLIGKREKMQVFGNDYPTPDGTCIRDYIHVNDLSSAHLLAMDYIMNTNQNIVVNLGSEKGMSVLEVLQITEKVTNKKVPYEIGSRRKGDAVKLLASSQKAKTILNWNPQFSDPETIIRTMWETYQKNA